jgi:hypothetical protein
MCSYGMYIYIYIHICIYIYVTSDQTIDHLLFQCDLLGKERDKLISGVLKTDNWPLRKSRLISEHYQSFSQFIYEISLERLNGK